VLITGLASALFIALSQFDDASRASLMLEETRNQEKFEIEGLVTDSEFTYITAIQINNTGSTAVKIKAVYLDGSLLWEPAETIGNINPKQSYVLTLPAQIPFVVTSKITLASERGVTTVAKEGDFYTGLPPPNQDQDLYFGPLKLDFEEFYYAKYAGGIYPDADGWIKGWQVARGTELVWKIVVKNVDERPITLNKYSCLTLIPNDGGSQLPWYIEKIIHSDGSNSTTIMPQETVSIYYRWATAQQTKTVKIFAARTEARVFLTFYGVFNENGTTKHYGQTIPFEAVLVT
jgi:hypothetical protein